MRKNILYVSFVLIGFLFTVFCVSCNKNNNTLNDQNKNSNCIEKATAKVSTLLTSMLKATKISNIKCVDKGIYEVRKYDGETLQAKLVSKNELTLEFKNGTNIKTSFGEDAIIMINLKTGVKQEFYEVSDITHNIDNSLLLSIAVFLYTKESDNSNLDIEVPMDERDHTHWCIYPRKSYCSTEHVNAIIKESCGHEPAKIYETDCGCLWGDFGCICLTDFDC